MWKKYLIIPIVIFISPAIGGKRKQSDSNDCQRTNDEAFRYCTKSCSSDSDCKSNQKCLCDEDCGMSCVRNNLRCEALTKSKNSRQKSSSGRSFNSVVTYTCKPPFKLRGSPTRTCRATGKWDGKKARCRIECKDPGEISSGNRRVEGLQAGKYIQYWCFESYNLIGSARIKCLETGEWSTPKPKCELPQCYPPKIPDSAIVFYPRRMKKTFKYSDRVLLKCKDGYFKSRGGVMSCLGSKQWTGDIICSPKSCGRPRDVSNGKIIGYLYSFKEKVRYVCNEGYKLNGPAYRICQANEEWGDREPTCEVVDCGPLDKPDHGDIIEQVGLTFGKRIVFECKDKGYELNGSRIRTCQSDGTWSGSLTTCDIVQCGDPGKPANGAQKVSKGFVYGGSVEFICDKDYTLSGTPTIYCRENKRWTASVPQCLAPCSDPGRPYQGNRIGNDFRHGKSVTFTCSKDYSMQGVRTITCSDGVWSNRKPSCKASCAKLAPPPHGVLSGEDFTHGASVMFYCRYGYTRVGASPITCNDGDWNKPPPVCKGICPQPRTPYKVRLLESKARYLDGDEVTFYCDGNHDLVGNDRILCVGKNWDSSVPVCKARCSFSPIPNGMVFVEGRRAKNGMIKHGEKVTYGCLPAYTLIGSKTRECDNGRWTSDAPVCKAPCPTPGAINHGTKVGTDYRHDKTVLYQCDADYTLKGSNRLTCKNGNWNTDPPECKAPCSNPGTPLNGSMQGDELRHDSWVTFTCDPNHRLDGNKNIHCNDGSWSGSVPNCVAVCPDPGVPSNGKRLDNNFQEGETVIFKCNKDHNLVGNSTIRCEGGIWSGEVPKCKARCTFDGNPVNGYTTDGNYRRHELLPDGSNVKYACHVSYTLVGSDVRHCDDGSWNTSLPSCKASCDDPGLLAKGRKIGNDYTHGQIVTYKCTAKGSSLVGNPTLTCNDGSWDSEKPECKASCDQLPVLFNGEVNNYNTNHEALVSFSCKKGFQLKGQRQIMCINGKWKPSPPTCEGVCKDPGLLDNGNVIGNDYSYNSSIRFHCSLGYDLLGAASLTCNKGRWNGGIPACKKRCQDPGNPPNGWKIGVNYSHGGSVQFRCKDGPFDLVGASRITCDEGEWSHPMPSCEARCSDPGIPNNGAKDGKNFRSRANVTFRCNPPLELIGSRVIFCQDGKWSGSTPTCSNCERPLGLEEDKTRIRSPSSLTDPRFPPNAARLNGPSAWCPSRTPAYLQIDLDKSYKLTAIATQGGTALKKWVQRYTISFYAGNIIIYYTESGSRKDILGNKDASSLVKYKFKEPFIASIVRINPSSSPNDLICLRAELYGCDPNPDCILVGSMFWGLWKYNTGANNYYKAYVTKLTATHLDFVLQFDNGLKRSYPRNDPVLILDTVPKMTDISINSSVIARQHSRWPKRFRSGIAVGFPGAPLVSVKFDDGEIRSVLLKHLRLVNRPRFCVNDI